MLFGSLSGHAPGITLPGGTNLPINWDFFTSLLIILNPVGFAGYLDDDFGSSFAQLVFPIFDPPGELTMTFAYALQGPPWDFASNAVLIELGP